MKEVLGRFSSRKFLLTVAGVVLVFAAPQHADVVVQLVAIFVGTEGAKDLAEAVKRNR